MENTDGALAANLCGGDLLGPLGQEQLPFIHLFIHIEERGSQIVIKFEKHKKNKVLTL